MQSELLEEEIEQEAEAHQEALDTMGAEHEEMVAANVIIQPDGEMHSSCGTHLGHNLPDGSGDRYCIDLVSVAGMGAARRVGAPAGAGARGAIHGAQQAALSPSCTTTPVFAMLSHASLMRLPLGRLSG